LEVYAVLIPSEILRQELGLSRDLVRFFQAENGTSTSSGLVIKSTSLDLKLLILRKKIEITLYQPKGNGRVVYIVRLDQGDDEPVAMWSPVESREELEAIRAVLDEGTCDIHLFNEADVDVCWTSCRLTSQDDVLKRIATAAVSPVPSHEEGKLEAEIDTVVRALNSGQLPQGVLTTLSLTDDIAWQEQFNHYITNRLAVCAISIISGDEGAQQEEMGLWLIDELNPSGGVKNPQVIEPRGPRELCDLLLTYSGGVFLFESKTLSVFDGDAIPTRARFSKNAAKNSRKAVRQLSGACKNIVNGLPVSDSEGRSVHIERRTGCHCVILVPDLALLADCSEFGGVTLKQFQRDVGGFLQWLDIAEMRVLAGTAHYMSSLGKTTSPMMAFDVLLFNRWNVATTYDDPNFGFRMNFIEDGGQG
jgi:hypothetical protein